MSQPNVSPAEAWRDLRQGNDRFVTGQPSHPRQNAERRSAVALQQTPRVAIFGCADSRLSAEIIFDLGLGDAFVVRNAGQVVTGSVLGSLEYAVGVLGVPLILVLGHDECGAVRAAIESQAADASPLPPHIASLTDRIVPAVRKVAGAAADSPVSPADVDAAFVGREHLRTTVQELIDGSEMISDAIAEGRLAVVGANYRLVEGRAETDVVVGRI
ncbi:carbonic anhydrase [Agromyces aerolatus]|uniref:carbonic anhydrase n=1 Tax=Agromyces sp. LY-1074 TaxID=3074080 RepID=UPI0028640DEC|nr:MULTISPECIES: carbonic anhydrase [unclassified Agromyces]MDR5698857.1 carbonic anhydrase [Agromyces sp. LY-1074]MDR5705365.1 carbonic anhydrase [Agromyces sp. LY-1358]